MYRKIISLVCLLGLPLAACDSGSPPAASGQLEEVAPVLEGVWQRAEIVIEGGHDAGSHLVDVQPSLYIFSKTHYALAAVEGFTPRAFLGEEPTDADRGRALIPYAGEMGTYAVEGDKLKLKPMVAKDPAAMQSAQGSEFAIVWDGIEVWLNTTAPDGGTVKTRLTRVDDDVRLATEGARRLAGVWRRAEMIVGSGPDAGPHSDDMQPGYYIFTPRAFVGTYVSAFAPRPPLGNNPTDDAWGKNYTSFVSFGGTYALRDGVLILRGAVSANPGNMQGRPFQSINVQWEGEDVWFIYTNAAGIENRTRLVRVPD